MSDETTPRERAVSGVKAAAITGQLVWQTAVAAPVPEQANTGRVESTDRVLQVERDGLPSMQDLVRQESNWERVNQDLERRRNEELGYQLREPEQREERSR